MPLARPCSSKPSKRQGHRYLASISATHVRDDSSHRWRRAGRGRDTEREPLSVMPFGHAVQVSTPRVHFCTFLSIGRAIWFPSSRRERNHQSAKAETSTAGITLGRPRHSLSGDVGGTPDLHRFRNNLRVSVPITCFHMVSVHIERGIRVLVPSRAISSDNRVPSISFRRHLL